MILLYDGNCSLCNFSVKIVDKFDKRKRILKISQNSDLAINVSQKYNLNRDIDSVVFINEDNVYLKSNAVIEAAAASYSIFKVFRILKLIPLKIRDNLYDFIAKHRSKLFGSSASCEIRN